MPTQDERAGYSAVGAPPNTPGLPQNPLPIILEGFDGLNTKASQQGIKDQELFVCDGLMPLGPDNLRCLRGLGDAIFTVPGGASPASGSIYFAVNPVNGSTVTLNGVAFTFVTSGGYPASSTNHQITIQGNTGGTIAMLVLALQTSTTYLADTALNVATYYESGGSTTDTLFISYKIAGTTGNAYTLAASVATRSAATLTGGAQTIVNFSFHNIGDLPICVVCLDDGSLVQVNLETLAVTYMSSGFATGSVNWGISGNANPGDTVTLNGAVFTFVASGATLSNYQVNIDAVTANTVFALWNLLTSSPTYLADVRLNVATYLEPAPFDIITITYNTVGTAGNAYTLAASAATISAATLTGGTSGAGIISTLPPAYSQWAGLYVIIVSPQTNGYFLWDGSNLFTSGTLGPQVDIINAGATYTSAPTITATGGTGTGATFTGTVANGSLVGVTVTEPGSGYLIGENVILTVTGGGSDDSGSATANINANSGVASVIVTNGGFGYSNLLKITTSAAGSSVQASFSVVGQNGTITQVTVENPGLGYTSVPTLTVTDLAAGAVGSGAILAAVMESGQIASVTVNSVGNGYVTPPTITIVGNGTGAVLNPHMSGVYIDSIAVVNAGTGYTKAVIQYNGGNDSAAATVKLMPFGISGATVETYMSRVWVGAGSNGRRGIVSAPGDPTDFDIPDGSVVFVSTDSFLRRAYTKFFQSNGFLYAFADSSINYISGVSTSGNPAQTTFNNLNVDPQIGTPWPNTVQPFGRDIVFANPVGVHVSYGGAVTKVSDALDGIYTTVTSDHWPEGFTPSAAVMNIYGIKVYILALPIVDQVTGATVVKCLMWDGKKWFTSPQEGLINPFLASQDFDSTLTAYCSSNNTTINAMFTDLSEAFTRYLYSKLWDKPGVFLTKVQREIFGVVNVNYLDPYVAATGNIYFTVLPTVGDSIVLNGRSFSFVASGATPSSYTFNIAASPGGTVALMVIALTTSATYLADTRLNVATYADSGGSTTDYLLITYLTTGTAGNAYTLRVNASFANAPLASGLTLTGGSDGPSFYIATLTENGAGAETSLIPTATGAYVFGPLRSADQGKLIGVRVRTNMADITLNNLLLLPNIQQSNA